MRRALRERLARRAFGVDDVMALKLDVIVFKLAHVAGIMQRNRCPIHEAPGAHQHAVCKDAVLLRHVQIRVRHVGREGRTRDANRQRFACPRRRSIAPGEFIATDPLNRPYSIGMRGQQISDSEIFDRTLASDCPNPGSL